MTLGHWREHMSSTASVKTSTPSPDLFADIAEFHKKFDISYDGPPRQLPPELLKFRVKFLYEEADEYEEQSGELEVYLEKSLKKRDAAIAESLADQLDALVD